MIEINSRRQFKIQTSNSTICEMFECELIDLLLLNEDTNSYEVFYSLNEIIDKVLDMHIGISVYFQPNRDDNFSKGIITRTN